MLVRCHLGVPCVVGNARAPALEEGRLSSRHSDSRLGCSQHSPGGLARQPMHSRFSSLDFVPEDVASSCGRKKLCRYLQAGTKTGLSDAAAPSVGFFTVSKGCLFCRCKFRVPTFWHGKSGCVRDVNTRLAAFSKSIQSRFAVCKVSER